MRHDIRSRMLLGVVLATLVGGLLVYLVPERARELAPPAQVRNESEAAPAVDHHESSKPGYPGEVHERFQQAAVMLHAGRPELALAALERVIELAPDLPEAHVNAGFAFLDLSNPAAARDHFNHALDLRSNQTNAYYGLALALEALGDLDSALGAMRTYVHLTEDEDPHRRKALSAIWEWQSRRDGPAGDGIESGPAAETASTGVAAAEGG